MANAHRSYVDNLRLSGHATQLLLDQLDRDDAASSKSKERRIDRRRRYNDATGIVVQMSHPGGSVVTYLVRPRNLSKTGIGFFHGSFVHSGTVCVMGLRTINNQVVRTAGKVCRCRHVTGHVHEVGVRFEHQIEVSEYLVRDEKETAEAAPSTELPTLKGSILYVEGSGNDQELIKFQLAEIGLEVQAVASGAEAVSAAATGKFDAVMIGEWLAGMSGADIAKELRKKKFAGPIILTTADERPETHSDTIKNGATGVLVKPYRLDELLKLVLPHLPPDATLPKQPPRMFSDHWFNARMRPLIVTYLQSLRTGIADLQKAIEGKKVEPAHKLCLNIKGSAGGYGYPQISHAAQTLFLSVVSEAAAAKCKEQLEQLQDLVNAAMRAVPEAGLGAPASAAAAEPASAK